MKNFLTQLILLMITFTLVCHVQAGRPNRKIEHQKFEIFNTGLGVHSCCDKSTTGIWLNNDLFAMTAMKDSHDAIEKQLLQVMLVDLKTKKSRVLVDTGQLVCWNPERQIASIQKIHSNATTDIQYELIHLDAHGKVAKLIGKKNISPHVCQSEALISLQQDSFSILLREPDGYIQRASADDLCQQKKSAILMRPGKAPLNLNLHSDEVSGAGNNIGNYLAYSQKYLLNTKDSQDNSRTNRKLADSSWNRPYDLTPYRLMARDGSIEEIPYPKIIFEYGIKKFAYFLPTPAGVIISTNNLFLLRDEQLTRIWPHPGRFAQIKRENIHGLVLSPDGCKIAFRHFAEAKPTTLKTVTIIKLCQKE